MKKLVIGVIAILIVILGGIYLTQRQESAPPAEESQDSAAPPSPPPTNQLQPAPTPSETPPAPTPQSPPPPAPTSPPPSAQTKTFSVSGQNFAFAPATIRVKHGDLVKITFESTGGFHDWTLEGYAVGTSQVNTGDKTSVEFVADKTGTFTFYCSVANHRQAGMVGTFIVE